MVDVDGTTVAFDVAAQGLLAGSPHAAHIHFGAQARHECPTASEDTDGNGHLNTSEGAPAYGPVAVSLTTEGDTSPESVLAVDRYATGPDIDYSRSDVQVSEELANAIVAGQGVAVVHGVDYNGNGMYDGDAGMSDLDPSLPAEATDPAICGVLAASQMSGMPQGGVDTGAGSTDGTENIGLIGAGGVALLGGAALAVRRRRLADDS